MPWAFSQLASRPPLLIACSGSRPTAVDGRFGQLYALLLRSMQERLVVEPAVESHAAAFAFGAFDFLGGACEGLFDCRR